MKWEHCYASLEHHSLSVPRFGHSAVATTDPTGNCQVVVYGGVGCHAGETAQTALGDVAVLQVDNGTWSAPDILPGPNPGPRAFHSAVSWNGVMLLFGGHILTFDADQNRKRRNFFSDVWLLDLVEWQWRQLPCDTSSSPAKRDMASLLHLGDGQLLLFGGRSEQGKALQDTWTYNIDSNTWQQMKPVGALPNPRKMHTMAKVGGQVVLFGGESDSGPLDDVWLLGGWGEGQTLRWTQLRLRTPPAARFGHAMAVCSLSGVQAGSASSSRRSSHTGTDATQEAAAAAPSPFIAAAAAAAAGAAAAGFDASAAGLEGDPAGTGFAADSSSISATAAAGGDTGGGDSATQQQQHKQQQQRVVVFGGCLDLSGFLSLNKNYVQSKETWLLQLDNLTWQQLPQLPAAAAAAAAGASSEPSAATPWPCERMCHSLTALPDGRMLAFGGRNKEGICRDMWLLETSGDIPAAADSALLQPAGGSLPLPPASPRPSTAGSTGSASGAAAKPSPSNRAGSQSLLQSLLGPVRARVPSQGLLRRESNTQLEGGSASTPTASTPNSSQPPSPKRTPPQQQQDEADLQMLQVPGQDKPHAQLQNSSQRQGHEAGNTSSSADVAAAAAAAAAAAGAGGSSSSSQPGGTSLGDVGSREFAKLLRNPAAYSAGAIGKLSSSVTSTVSSLLVGKDGQPGPMLPRLPEALMRVAPNWGLYNPLGPFSSRGPSNSNSQEQQQQQGPFEIPALAPLRQHMGLLGQHIGVGGAHGAHELKAPVHVLQELAMLGQHLLSDSLGAAAVQAGSSAPGSFASNSSIPTEVLVTAARQHLMSAEALQLQIPHVALLLADYQQLAASYHAHLMLSRLSEGFTAAAAAASGASAAVDGAGQCGSAFLQRQPADLLIDQVEQLQQHYQRLLLQSLA